MPYNIFDTDKKQLVKNWLGSLVEFPTSEAALDAIKGYPEGKFQLRRVTNLDENWQQREKTRYESGEYILPEFLKEFRDLNKDHYLRLCMERPGHLTYYSSVEKAQKDQPSIISILGYLEKYYVGFSQEKYNELKDQLDQFLLENDGLKFATEAEEIARVYTDFDKTITSLSQSCMRYKFSRLSDHPTTVYSAGDLAIAYLVNKEGKTKSRCLVHPEKKLYGRVYGQSVIHDLLKKRGWQKSNYYGPGFESMSYAKLLLIPDGCEKNEYLMPYLDEKLGIVRNINDKFWTLVPYSEIGKYDNYSDTDLTNGTTGDTDGAENDDDDDDDDDDDHEYRCMNCDSVVNENDLGYVTVSHRNNHFWCTACTMSDAFYSDYSGNLYSIQYFNSVVMADGEIWTEEEFQRSGFICPRTGKNYHNLQGKFIEENGEKILVSKESIQEKLV